MVTAGSWRQRGVLTLAALSVSLLGAGVAVSPAQADETVPTKVLLLLDVSGSMNEKIASGGTKFAAAKKALKQVAGALPAGTQVGLRVYGSTIAEPKSRNPKACTDTELVMPLGPLNKSRMYRAVDSFTAKGETPIAYSLEKAVRDLGPSGKRVVVLISDGEETCKADPCPSARKLARSGVDLQFNAIGLAVNASARRQLQCIADAGDGSYYDASRSSELSEAIKKITQRALRPFQVNGTRVQGTTDPAVAPEVKQGQYVDRYNASGTSRYYRISRTPGSIVTASITSIVNAYPSQNREFWKIQLATADGTACGNYQASTSSYRGVTVVSGAATSGNDSSVSTSSVSTSSESQRCSTDPTLLLSLSRTSGLGNSDTNPVEILISEEQPIMNLAELPVGLSSYSGKGKAVAVSKPVRAVIGGTAFSNAEAVTAGSWIESIAAGETVLYKVRLEPGQRLRVTAEAPAPKTPWTLSRLEAVTPAVILYAPSRLELTRQQDNLQGPGRTSFTATSPEVRVRNRETAWPQGWSDKNALGAASIAGDYYVAVELDVLQKELLGRVMSIRLNVSIDGQPTGVPEYGTATTVSPTPSSAPASTPAATSDPSRDPADTSRSLPTAVAVGAGAALATAVIGTGLALSRRRSRRV
jgi:Ca-activated chloride channel family protein